jgi:hypothetical protein
LEVEMDERLAPQKACERERKWGVLKGKR